MSLLEEKILWEFDVVPAACSPVNLCWSYFVPYMLYDTFSVQNARLKLVQCVESGCYAGIEPLDVA